ncbi:hypothetical protein chiPu_0013755 [Chiloscyllium punctatum]|uniref:LRRNT domain-containing protein n=1 Tax=Chiloscyllium punctatum TaxID=137246 RepID=A0A401SXZ0_CHIPU|nr:hypothetical protein [Chiloscyllium punctatum]
MARFKDRFPGSVLLTLLFHGFCTHACPSRCVCSGSNVDCHHLGLKAVPRGIPRNTERLDLDKNNITRISKMDFVGLKNLRVLHLEENQINVIERGAFQDLKQLERLFAQPDCTSSARSVCTSFTRSTQRIGLGVRAVNTESLLCCKEPAGAAELPGCVKL